MVDIFCMVSSGLVLTLAAYIVFCHIKLRKILEEIEDLKLENSKLSFRLFIAEKRQKMINDHIQISNISS